ncbi:aldose 1-epimerase [Litorimonas cladophorae]|uniref:Aldose 1-epimerase n=1 Tax=Litorimonas cladophorae TaxID=1220491 RepID=A0A918NFT4_9PROT|nr:aldose epimerase family protein [Litorimonas cladophorae]GGX64722.1 aldose 1-epimerase [Litorimonas cladophorae]
MINERHFGTTQDGREISAYELGLPNGITATILNYGATLQALYLPDGRNVTLGYGTLEPYVSGVHYLGGIVGRNANRIAPARMIINGTKFQLTATDGEANLHSGPMGFETQIWSTSVEDNALVLHHISPDGDGGFPGELDVTLRIIVGQMSLRLEMLARTTKPTPVNMTWHPYWNLLGKGRIDGHVLSAESTEITVLQKAQPMPLNQTRFDFRQPLALGSVQIDDNYVNIGKASVSANGTTLHVSSSLPDLQIYTGDHLPVPRSGIALEPQYRPNDINFAQNCLLQPEQTYNHWIEYSFETT